MSKRFFVTGCAGFLGAAVCRKLIDAGHQVVGVDNLSADYDPLVKRFRLAALAEEPLFRCHHQDLSRWSELERTFEWAARERPIDAVLHFAGRAGHGAVQPLAVYKLATAGTLKLLELCRQYGVPRFLLASDAQVDSPAGAAMAGAEGFCHAHHHLHGTHIGVLRFREVYGPAGRPDRAAFRYVRWISEGEPAPIPRADDPGLDYVFLDDAVRGVLSALEIPGCHTWEIGTGARTSLAEVVEILAILVGRATRLVPDAGEFNLPAFEQDSGLPEAESPGRIPGWRPQVSLPVGLCAALEWYETYRDVAQLVELGIEGRRRSRRTAALYRQAQRREAA